MNGSDFMRFWKTMNDLLVSYGQQPMLYGQARMWWQQHQGWAA